MTWKQMKEIEKSLPPRFKRNELTKEQKKAYDELDCISMINSCLIYWTNFLESHYKNNYIEDLWEKRVIELYNEQKSDFDKSQVNYCVYTDDEGCTYNSIKRRDE
jgi:hypothetical protein